MGDEGPGRDESAGIADGVSTDTIIDEVSNAEVTPSPDILASTDPALPPNKSKRRRVLLAAAGLLVVVIVVAVVVILRTPSITGIPLGPGTATITWNGTHQTGHVTGPNGSYCTCTQPYVGIVAGRRVSGDDSLVAFGHGSGLALTGRLHTSPFFHITGTLGGTHFNLHVVLRSRNQYVKPNEGTKGQGPSVRMFGTFGSMPVVVQIIPHPRVKWGFKGTIGKLHVTGKIVSVQDDGKTSSATAVFDVTK